MKTFTEVKLGQSCGEIYKNDIECGKKGKYLSDLEIQYMIPFVFRKQNTTLCKMKLPLTNDIIFMSVALIYREKNEKQDFFPKIC